MYENKFTNTDFQSMLETLNRPLQLTDVDFNKKILIVDDEPFNLMGLKIVLRTCLKNMHLNPDIATDIVDSAFNGQ